MRASRLVLLVLGVVFCGLFAAQAQASDARLDALAVQREYVEDYFNFRTFPTVAARYANLVTASLGTQYGNDKSVGVIGAGDNTNYGVFALYLNQVQVNGVEQGQIDLTWAKQFTNMALGFGALYQTSTEKGNLATNSERSPIGGPDLSSFAAPGTDVFSLTGGAKFEMANNAMLELAADVAWLSWKVDANGDGTNESEDAGNLSYKLSGRLMNEVSDKTTVVPILQYARVDLAEKAIGGAAEDANNAKMMNVGVAMNHKVNGDDLLILGVSADYNARKQEAGGVSVIDENNWSIPTLFAALEFDVYSWLTVRAGAHKTFDHYTDNVGNEKSTDSSYQFGLGMGLHFDHFDVDATVNENSVFTGGYLFSGEASQPFGRITGTYYF
jgi:hypothetical protein